MPWGARNKDSSTPTFLPQSPLSSLRVPPCPSPGLAHCSHCGIQPNTTAPFLRLPSRSQLSHQGAPAFSEASCQCQQLVVIFYGQFTRKEKKSEIALNIKMYWVPCGFIDDFLVEGQLADRGRYEGSPSGEVSFMHKEVPLWPLCLSLESWKKNSKLTGCNSEQRSM